MHTIPTSTDEVLAALGIGARFLLAPEPGVIGLGTLGFIAAVLVFEFERDCAEETCPLLPHIACQEKGTDVLADAVVEVGMPPLGLVFDGFPADKDIQRGLAFPRLCPL